MIMPLPSIFLGFIISTLYGALFHVWRGGSAGKLLLYLILGWFGFWVGHFLGGYFRWSFDKLGPLHLGSATMMSAIFLLVGYWLTLVEVKRE